MYIVGPFFGFGVVTPLKPEKNLCDTARQDDRNIQSSSGDMFICIYIYMYIVGPFFGFGVVTPLKAEKDPCDTTREDDK